MLRLRIRNIPSMEWERSPEILGKRQSFEWEASCSRCVRFRIGNGTVEWFRTEFCTLLARFLTGDLRHYR